MIDQKMLISRDGNELYVFSIANRGVRVLGVKDFQTKRTFDLPLPANAIFMPGNGKQIYISGHTPFAAVMVVDTATRRVVEVIPTGAPAFGIAVTPNEKKLFRALGPQGFAFCGIGLLALRLRNK